jgi:hypothetical protein
MLLFHVLACSGEASSDTAEPPTGSDAPAPTNEDTTAVAPPAHCPPAETPAGHASLDGMAPVVVCTWPISGDGAVDPALDAIVVSFSKDMLDGAWAWVQVDATFPETTGNAYYEADGRTNVLPVALEPDTTYTVWVNDPFGTYSSFQDEAGRPAAPYPISFHTAR